MAVQKVLEIRIRQTEHRPIMERFNVPNLNDLEFEPLLCIFLSRLEIESQKRSRDPNTGLVMFLIGKSVSDHQ